VKKVSTTASILLWLSIKALQWNSSVPFLNGFMKMRAIQRLHMLLNSIFVPRGTALPNRLFIAGY
jgi:hypothetical protein